MEMRKFFIRPFIPEKIHALHELSMNLWSYWDKDAGKLFRRLDIIVLPLIREHNHFRLWFHHRVVDKSDYPHIHKNKG